MRVGWTYNESAFDQGARLQITDAFGITHNLYNMGLTAGNILTFTTVDTHEAIEIPLTDGSFTIGSGSTLLFNPNVPPKVSRDGYGGPVSAIGPLLGDIPLKTITMNPDGSVGFSEDNGLRRMKYDPNLSQIITYMPEDPNVSYTNTERSAVLPTPQTTGTDSPDPSDATQTEPTTQLPTEPVQPREKKLYRYDAFIAQDESLSELGGHLLDVQFRLNESAGQDDLQAKVANFKDDMLLWLQGDHGDHGRETPEQILARYVNGFKTLDLLTENDHVLASAVGYNIISSYSLSGGARIPQAPNSYYNSGMFIITPEPILAAEVQNSDNTIKEKKLYRYQLGYFYGPDGTWDYKWRLVTGETQEELQDATSADNRFAQYSADTMASVAAQRAAGYDPLTDPRMTSSEISLTNLSSIQAGMEGDQKKYLDAVASIYKLMGLLPNDASVLAIPAGYAIVGGSPELRRSQPEENYTYYDFSWIITDRELPSESSAPIGTLDGSQAHIMMTSFGMTNMHQMGGVYPGMADHQASVTASIILGKGTGAQVVLLGGENPPSGTIIPMSFNSETKQYDTIQFDLIPGTQKYRVEVIGQNADGTVAVLAEKVEMVTYPEGTSGTTSNSVAAKQNPELKDVSLDSTELENDQTSLGVKYRSVAHLIVNTEYFSGAGIYTELHIDGSDGQRFLGLRTETAVGMPYITAERGEWGGTLFLQRFYGPEYGADGRAARKREMYRILPDEQKWLISNGVAITEGAEVFGVEYIVFGDYRKPLSTMHSKQYFVRETTGLLTDTNLVTGPGDDASLWPVIAPLHSNGPGFNSAVLEGGIFKNGSQIILDGYVGEGYVPEMHKIFLEIHSIDENAYNSHQSPNLSEENSGNLVTRIPVDIDADGNFRVDYILEPGIYYVRVTYTPDMDFQSRIGELFVKVEEMQRLKVVPATDPASASQGAFAERLTAIVGADSEAARFAAGLGRQAGVAHNPNDDDFLADDEAAGANDANSSPSDKTISADAGMDLKKEMLGEFDEFASGDTALNLVKAVDEVTVVPGADESGFLSDGAAVADSRDVRISFPIRFKDSLEAAGFMLAVTSLPYEIGLILTTSAEEAGIFGQFFTSYQEHAIRLSQAAADYFERLRDSLLQNVVLFHSHPAKPDAKYSPLDVVTNSKFPDWLSMVASAGKDFLAGGLGVTDKLETAAEWIRDKLFGPDPESLVSGGGNDSTGSISGFGDGEADNASSESAGEPSLTTFGPSGNESDAAQPKVPSFSGYTQIASFHNGNGPMPAFTYDPVTGEKTQDSFYYTSASQTLFDIASNYRIALSNGDSLGSIDPAATAILGNPLLSTDAVAETAAGVGYQSIYGESKIRNQPVQLKASEPGVAAFLRSKGIGVPEGAKLFQTFQYATGQDGEDYTDHIMVRYFLTNEDAAAVPVREAPVPGDGSLTVISSLKTDGPGPESVSGTNSAAAGPAEMEWARLIRSGGLTGEQRASWIGQLGSLNDPRFIQNILNLLREGENYNGDSEIVAALRGLLPQLESVGESRVAAAFGDREEGKFKVPNLVEGETATALFGDGHEAENPGDLRARRAAERAVRQQEGAAVRRQLRQNAQPIVRDPARSNPADSGVVRESPGAARRARIAEERAASPNLRAGRSSIAVGPAFMNNFSIADNAGRVALIFGARGLDLRAFERLLPDMNEQLIAALLADPRLLTLDPRIRAALEARQEEMRQGRTRTGRSERTVRESPGAARERRAAEGAAIRQLRQNAQRIARGPARSNPESGAQPDRGRG